MCGSCHDKAERGWISAAAVASADASPVALKRGYAKDDLLFESQVPYIRLGSNSFFCRYPIVYHNELILGFDPPESPGAPLRLQATIYGKSGDKILEIVDNEWRVGAGLFDVTSTANRLVVREASKAVSLQISFTSDKGLTIEELHMFFHGCSVDVKGDTVSVKPSPKHTVLHLNLCKVVNAEAGIYLPATGGIQVSPPVELPFFKKDISDFGPSNELEQALCQARDSPAAYALFLAKLYDSDVFVVSECKEPVKVSLSCWQLPAEPNRLVVLTAASRFDAIKRRCGSHSEHAVIPFADLLQVMPAGLEILLNLFCPVTLKLMTAQFEQFRGGRAIWYRDGDHLRSKRW
jgi:hypothetical protein